MIIRWLKISAALFLTLILSVSLTKLIICVWENFQFSCDERFDVEIWLEQNRLGQHKEAFKKRGKLKKKKKQKKIVIPNCLQIQGN